MCYLIAKNVDAVGCVALRTTHGKHLSEFKRKIEQAVGYDKIQLVTISRPCDVSDIPVFMYMGNEDGIYLTEETIEEYEDDYDIVWFDDKE